MKTFLSFLILLVAFVSPEHATLAKAVPSDDGFSTFYATFRKAVVKNDRAAIKNMMPSRFDWALDGYISRDDALRQMDEGKLWRGLRNAVTRKPVICCSSCCHSRSGYYLSSSPQYPARYAIEIMFERGADGQWRWTGLLGD